MHFVVICFLFIFGLYCFLLPFTNSGLTFPTWIRIALWIMALSFVGGNLLDVALNSVSGRITRHTYDFLYVNKTLIFGMGLGIGLLLIASGDIFRAFLHSKEIRERKQRDKKREKEEEGPNLKGVLPKSEVLKRK